MAIESIPSPWQILPLDNTSNEIWEAQAWPVDTSQHHDMSMQHIFQALEAPFLDDFPGT
jgi:hypothetical protein